MKTSPDSSSDFIAHVKYGFTHFLSFRGRSTRPQFWWYYLCLWLINGVLNMFGKSFIASPPETEATVEQISDFHQLIWSAQPVTFKVYLVVSAIVGLVLFISVLAATVRRLHDAGYSATLAYIASTLVILLTAWPYLFLFFLSDVADLFTGNETTATVLFAALLLALVVLLVIGIIVLVRLIMPSEPRDNAYGPYGGREN